MLHCIGRDDNYLATSFFSLTVFPVLALFSVLLVTRLSLLPLFASPLSSGCDFFFFLYMGGKCKQREIRFVLYMCRDALGICEFLCSSCCVSVSEFLQRLSPLSPLRLLLYGISSIFRLAACMDVVGRSGPQ